MELTKSSSSFQTTFSHSQLYSRLIGINQDGVELGEELCGGRKIVPSSWIRRKRCIVTAKTGHNYKIRRCTYQALKFHFGNSKKIWTHKVSLNRNSCLLAKHRNIVGAPSSTAHPHLHSTPATQIFVNAFSDK